MEEYTQYFPCRHVLPTRIAVVTGYEEKCPFCHNAALKTQLATIEEAFGCTDPRLLQGIHDALHNQMSDLQQERIALKAMLRECHASLLSGIAILTDSGITTNAIHRHKDLCDRLAKLLEE